MMMSDAELCSNGTILDLLKTVPINTGAFTKAYPSGAPLASFDQVYVKINGVPVLYSDYGTEFTSIGLHGMDIRQNGAVLAKTFPNTPRRVPFEWTFRYGKMKVTAAAAATAKANQTADAAGAAIDKENWWNWLEFSKVGTQDYQVNVDRASPFLVELDSAGAPVACYGENSSRNICISMGGKYNINAAPGVPRCTKT